jgi:hypothetical protein
VGVTRALNIITTEAERAKALERRRETFKSIGDIARRAGDGPDELRRDDCGRRRGTDRHAGRNRGKTAGSSPPVGSNTCSSPPRRPIARTLETFARDIAPHVGRAPARTSMDKTRRGGMS